MVPTFVHYFSLFPLVFSTTEHKALHSSRTKDGEILDETVFTNPKSFDYDFSDDLVHVADKFDIYDELLSQLPKFNLYKHGRDHGTTTVPVVTRQWDTWYTAVIDGNELITFRPMMHNFQSTKKPLKKLSSKKNRILTFEHSIMHSPKIAKEIANEFSTTTFTVMQRTKSASRSILNDSTPKSVKTAPRKTAMLTTSTTLSPKTLIPRKTKQAREVPRPTTTSDFFMTKMRATVSPRTRGIWRRETTITKDTKSTSSTIMRTTSTTTTPIPTPAAFHANKTGRYSQRRLLERQHSETRFYSTSTLPSKQLGSTLLRKNVAPKPAVIRLNPEDYKGPTFNCRVLNPNIDGSATKNHDPSCPLSFSEFSANGTCRCYYKISSRDENGCAIGFFYACKPLWNKNVAV